MIDSNRRSVLRVAALAAATAALSTSEPLHAQAYPNKPIKLVVAFPPGGPTDIVARAIAGKLSEQMGQAVLVENKAGAGGNLGADFVAKSAPDGYTLFYNTSAIAIAPALYGKLSYDVLKDFEPIVATAAVAMVLLVHPSFPAKNVREWIAHVKANPDKINYASTGSGTITHLAMAALASHAGLSLQHVPYKGSSPALVDLVAGTTTTMIDTMNSSLPFVRDGRLRALAVTTGKRSKVFPDLPTLNETELPGMQMSAWQGLLAPAGTPKAIIDKLVVDVTKVLAAADVQDKLAAQGTEVIGSTTAEYASFVRAELARWSKLVKETGAKAD